ncbi:hypothetical protein SAMN04488542_1593 [Fontibacillus panacisegetis]|uniref:Uncharacterized protein n=2 Tax=Fontibacillus panacisegetis TaxID=670482 RepID=A0A1G7V686_9BACL|nr:hypothetical protein SAMN04488542_1593 [Fontibacillus panacisegetis]
MLSDFRSFKISTRLYAEKKRCTTVIHERQMKKIARDDKLLREMIAAIDKDFHVLKLFRGGLQNFLLQLARRTVS